MQLAYRIPGLICILLLSSFRVLAADHHADDVAEQIAHEGDANHIKWRIYAPTVTQPRTDYPGIRFLPYDHVSVNAGGCVQTGGHGKTWKRYVDASGDDSDRIYHGRIRIPGATDGLVRVWEVLGRDLEVDLPPHYDGSPLFLQLGYEDGDDLSHYENNGYWGHDDGTDDQCKDVGPAWVEITIWHRPEATGPSFHFPGMPMDLYWTRLDDNFLPLNPAWSAQIGLNIGPHGPIPFINDVILDTGVTCGEFQMDGDNLNPGACVSWHPDVDEPHLPMAAVCQRDHSAGTVHGHINWGPATYTGTLYFHDFSKSPFLDGDYDWELIPDVKPNAGVTSHNADSDLTDHGGIVLEFHSNETVDKFESANTWWTQFKHAVDADAPTLAFPCLKFVDICPDYHYPQGQAMVNGLPAIVTGLLGIDNQHGGHTELHPLWGMAFNTVNTTNDYNWPMLARNWGDEGDCSQDQHYIDLRKFTFFFPYSKAGTTIANSNSDIRLGTPTFEFKPDGMLVSVNLGAPESQPYVFGELRFHKETSDLGVKVEIAGQPITGSTIRYLVKVSNSGPDPARFVTINSFLSAGVQFTDGKTTATATIEIVPPGQTITVSFDATISCALADGAQITNTVTLDSPTRDSNPSDNRFVLNTNVINPPPVITPPPAATGYTGAGATICAASVPDATIGQATVTDNCPGATLVRTGVPANNLFPVGDTRITYTSVDSGGATSTAAQTVTVIDNTPPLMSNVLLDRSTIWPADHSMSPVNESYSVTDNCPLVKGPICNIQAGSSEPDSRTGAGDLSPDWTPVNGNIILLRAERAGPDHNRMYTLTTSCADDAGNVSSKIATVVVPANPPPVDPNRTSQRTDVQQASIAELPDSPRDALRFAFLAPEAAVIARSEFSTGNPSLTGKSGTRSMAALDGFELLDPVLNVRSLPGLDTVEEMSVERSAYSAALPFSSGLFVDMISRAAGDSLHGDLGAFLAPTALSARDYFDTAPSRGIRQMVSENANVGAPIPQSRFFAFAGFERNAFDTARYRDYGVSDPGPTADQQTLIAKLRSSSDPSGPPVAAALQRALSPAIQLPDGAAGAGSRTEQVRRNLAIGRLDYSDTRGNAFMVSYAYTGIDHQGPASTYAAGLNTGTADSQADHAIRLSYTTSLSAAMSNQIRAEFLPHTTLSMLPPSGSAAAILVTGLASIGGPDQSNQVTERGYDVDDDLSWIRGRHVIKVGYTTRPRSYNLTQAFAPNGEFSFSPGAFPLSLAVPDTLRPQFLALTAGLALPEMTAFQSFTLGLPAFFRQTFNAPKLTPFQERLGAYASDSFRLNARTTLDFGFRSDGSVANNPQPSEFFASPRGGLAWVPTKSGNTVLRAGTGLYHAPASPLLFTPLESIGFLEAETGIAVRGNTAALSPIDFWRRMLAIGRPLRTDDPIAPTSAPLASTAGYSTYRIGGSWRPAFTVQTSAGIQQRLPLQMSLEAAYLDYEGRNLPAVQDRNYGQTGAPSPFGANFGASYERIDSSIAHAYELQPVGRSSYHGATVTLTRSVSNMVWQASYAFAHARDNLAPFNFPEAVSGTSDTAPSVQDIHHSFQLRSVFRTPEAWKDAGMPLRRILAGSSAGVFLRARSGLPFTAVTGADTNGSGLLNDRPVADERNQARLPAYASVDARLRKSFRAGERCRIDGIVEASNLTNHSNVRGIVTSAGPAFLTANAPPFAAGPAGPLGPLGINDVFPTRQIQIALRIGF